MIYAIGGGLIEVLISPIMELPDRQQRKSDESVAFIYCWGREQLY